MGWLSWGLLFWATESLGKFLLGNLGAGNNFLCRQHDSFPIFIKSEPRGESCFGWSWRSCFCERRQNLREGHFLDNGARTHYCVGTMSCWWNVGPFLILTLKVWDDLGDSALDSDGKSGQVASQLRLVRRLVGCKLRQDSPGDSENILRWRGILWMAIGPSSAKEENKLTKFE